MESQMVNKQENVAFDSQVILRITYPRHWILLASFVGLSLVAIGYMLFGSISETIEGNAMILTPGTVVPFQATASGRIAKWHVKVGDYLKKGQLLVELEQPLIEKQLEQASEQLSDIENRNETVTSYMNLYNNLEKEAITRKKKMLQTRIAELQDEVNRRKKLLNKVYLRKEKYLDQQRQDLEVNLELNKKRIQEMKKNLQLVQKLRDQGLRSEDQVLAARRQLISQEDRAAKLVLQSFQVALTKSRAVENRLNAMNSIIEQEQQIESLNYQLATLESREAQLIEQYQTSYLSMSMDVSDIKRTIAQSQQQLTEESEIRSEYEGWLLEVTAGEGKIVSKGMNLGTIDTRRKEDKLKAVAYFKLADGKKVKPGMKIRLLPATVEKERFGGLIGLVASVSEYSVTADAVARTIGNKGVATSLTKDGHEIEVFAELIKDNENYSGYKWERFDGPKVQVTSGTVGTVLVNIKEVAPLTYIIPILRDWQGF